MYIIMDIHSKSSLHPTSPVEHRLFVVVLPRSRQRSSSICSLTLYQHLLHAFHSILAASQNRTSLCSFLLFKRFSQRCSFCFMRLLTSSHSSFTILIVISPNSLKSPYNNKVLGLDRTTFEKHGIQQIDIIQRIYDIYQERSLLFVYKSQI